MGYVEETGAAQHYRDARISPIYEGTNGIQAADLVGRKLGLEGGAVLAPPARRHPRGRGRRERRSIGLVDDCEAVAGAAARAPGPDDRLAASYPFLTMLSVAVCGLADGAAGCGAGGHDGDPAFKAMKQAAARFYLDQVVPEARGLKAAAAAPADILYSVTRKPSLPDLPIDPLRLAQMRHQPVADDRLPAARRAKRACPGRSGRRPNR